MQRLSDNENEQIKGKVDRIFNKRYELVLEQGTQDEILQASEELIDRFKNNTEYRNQLQKAMIKKAEILEETNRDEEALEAYDEFLAMFE
jgi:thioredoxin-like negative regulator of GroEL